MQSLSSSRPCTAHFTGGNLLFVLLCCLLAKTRKYFILYYLKTATSVRISSPFPVQHVLLAVCDCKGQKLGSPSPCVCAQCSACRNGALQEPLPLLPKGLPASGSLTPVTAGRTLKNTISLFGVLA